MSTWTITPGLHSATAMPHIPTFLTDVRNEGSLRTTLARLDSLFETLAPPPKNR